MAFRLGNFNIDEILYGTAQNFKDELLYTLDQLSSASIEISAESVDITDKKGNVVRTVYTSKTGTFTATNAFLPPALMIAASGSDIENASDDAPIEMPKIEILTAGATATLADVVEGTVKVIGLYGNGSNGKALTQSTDADYEAGTFGYANGKVTVPAAGDDLPIQYLVKYQRTVTSGMKLVNTADKFPSTVRLTLYCSYIDPCDDDLKPCYVYIPSFMADPSVTISLDRETQEMDFNGTLQMDYCGTEKNLYFIYFPDEDIVVSGTVTDSEEEEND